MRALSLASALAVSILFVSLSGLPAARPALADGTTVTIAGFEADGELLVDTDGREYLIMPETERPADLRPGDKVRIQFVRVGDDGAYRQAYIITHAGETAGRDAGEAAPDAE